MCKYVNVEMWKCENEGHQLQAAGYRFDSTGNLMADLE
jgi:hypothetical protein